MSKILPKDTNISTYFEYRDRIFEQMTLPDGRILIQIVHTWCDTGEIMGFGFQYSDGISRSGINPLHIVKIYDTTPTESELWLDLDKFIAQYCKGTLSSPG